MKRNNKKEKKTNTPNRSFCSTGFGKEEKSREVRKGFIKPEVRLLLFVYYLTQSYCESFSLLLVLRSELLARFFFVLLVHTLEWDIFMLLLWRSVGVGRKTFSNPLPILFFKSATVSFSVLFI